MLPDVKLAKLDEKMTIKRGKKKPKAQLDTTLFNQTRPPSTSRRRPLLVPRPTPQKSKTNKTYPKCLGPAAQQKCVGDFCCIKFGGFCRGFSWRIFWPLSPRKMRKNSGEKIREKIWRLKIKTREKSVLPKSNTKMSTKRR